MLNKTFVVGDIHNRISAFNQCLEQSSFDKINDRLIVLGDVVDGLDAALFEVFEVLIGIKHLVVILGNHDLWFKNWVETGVELPIHIHQGGYFSLKSYDFDRRNAPQSHIDLLKNALPYYIDELNNLYVHGGFRTHQPIESQPVERLMWDRDLAYAYGRRYAKNPLPYRHVFLGHTSTQAIAHSMEATKPITYLNVTCLDTGGGWNGKLTIMNVETLAYWQSDKQTSQ